MQDKTSSIKLVVLSANEYLDPSTRFRIYQYFSLFQERSIQPRLFYFVDNKDFKKLYVKKTLLMSLRLVGRSSLRMLRTIPALFQADVVWIQREATSIGPPILEWLAHIIGKPMILDIDDAVHLPRKEVGVNGKLVDLLKFTGKTRHIVKWADKVVCGNPHLQEYIRNVSEYDKSTFVPTVVDMSQFAPAQMESESDSLVIGWIGSHSTAKFLEQLRGPLQQLSSRYDFCLHIIGAGKELEIEGVQVINSPWKLEDEVTQFQSFDIGIYPLPFGDEVALGKSGFKAIQYAAVGIPCVVSPVGIVADLVEDGVSGFHAKSEEEWFSYLEKLLVDGQLRKEMSARARELALRDFNRDRWFEQIYQTVVEVIEEQPGKNPDVRNLRQTVT